MEFFTSDKLFFKKKKFFLIIRLIYKQKYIARIQNLSILMKINDHSSFIGYILSSFSVYT